jgi:hypothetical protein
MEASEDVEIVSIPPKTDRCPDDPEARAVCQKAQALSSALLELNAQISVVKGARIDYQDDKAVLNNLRELFEKANTDLIARHNNRFNVMMNEENKLRELTLAAYALDPGNKKPAPGVGIRVSQIPTYDAEFALPWVAENYPHSHLLSLEKTRFGKFVKNCIDAGSGILPPDLKAELKEQITATISDDLGGD